MKFTCTKSNIASALSLVSGVAIKNFNLPILNNILIKAEEQKVEIISTNLELAIIINIRAKVETPGSFTVPAKTLTEFINLLSDESVIFELKENELQIKCAKSSTKIKGMSAEDFPVLPAASEGNGYLLKTEELKKGLSQVIISMAKNDIRPELAGVLCNFEVGIDKFVMAATDSYRLSEKKIKLEQGKENFRIIIPAKTAQEIHRVISANSENTGEKTVRVLLSESQIVINYDNAQIISRLVDGQYPDYTQIIPNNFKTTAEFSVSQLSKEIKTASLFASAVNGIILTFSPNDANIKISSTSTQTGEYISGIEAKVEGEEFSILLNHRYLLDGLNNLSGDKGVFQIINADSPCLLKEQSETDCLYVIMPIRQ
jgi:DNA polymerase-3 subunit beta